MPPVPRILLTNDDGIDSPGLLASVRACMGLGDLVVVAPAHQQTAMGRSCTGRKEAILVPVPLEVDGQPIRAYSLEASPASVVRHGLQVCFADAPPQLVVSGINYGENVGTSITASGTVGAAFEAASWGIPALAAALQTHPKHFFHHGEVDWHAAEHFVRLFVERMLRVPLPDDVDVLKLDVPEDATPETPWHLTRLARQRYFVLNLEEPHLGSRLGDARIGIQVDHDTLKTETDVHALAVARCVAVTPLSLDATSRTDFHHLRTTLA